MREYIAEYYATRVRRGTLLIMVAGAAFFAALLAVMFYLRWVAEGWPKPFHFPSLLMATALTLFAVCASATAETSARSAGLADRDIPVRWMAVSVSCWMMFLFLEVVEWVRLVFMERLGWDTTFGATFLSLTGAHWIAVCAGVCWMTYVAADVRRRDTLAAAMYSHFLSAVWILLLFTLYFSNADLSGIS